MKKMMVFAMAALAAGVSFAASVDAMTQDVNVVVTSFSARQRYPWNGKVDLDFSIDSTMPEAFSFVRFAASYVNGAGETVNVPMRTFDHGASWFCASSGTYRVTWDSTADVPTLMVSNLTYTVTATMAKYMVIDLSKGTSATADAKARAFSVYFPWRSSSRTIPVRPDATARRTTAGREPMRS